WLQCTTNCCSARSTSCFTSWNASRTWYHSQAGFLYRGIWLSITPIPSGTCKPVFLELLDRLEAPGVPDGYGISVAYSCLLDVINSIASIICTPKKTEILLNNSNNLHSNNEESAASNLKTSSATEQTSEISACDKICDIDCPTELSEQIINSTWCGLLAAFTLLIEASTDETATENILKAMQIYSSLCGTLNMTIPRDAFITAMCKASLPPHYTLTVLNTNLLKSETKGERRRECDDISHSGLNCNNLSGASQLPLGLYLGSCDGHDMRQQVVAVGTPLPTASLPLGAQQGPVMLTAKKFAMYEISPEFSSLPWSSIRHSMASCSHYFTTSCLDSWIETIYWWEFESQPFK
ncbi:protein MON2 homolog, partial [Caerostris extrusa]